MQTCRVPAERGTRKESNRSSVVSFRVARIRTPFVEIASANRVSRRDNRALFVLPE